jgi:hypothetical protein
MKTILVFCIFLVQSVLALQYASPSQQQQKQRKLHADANRLKSRADWRPGAYRGLKMGKSSRADVLRVLGEPKRVDTPADQPPNDLHSEVWYVYDGGGEFPGELTVVIDKRTDVLLGIDLSPDNLAKEDAVKHFGPDYILTRYDFDECLGNEESAPLYESPNGSLLEVEYRQRGIAISLDDDGKVNTISYVSKPIGSQQSRCHPNRHKRVGPKK